MIVKNSYAKINLSLEVVGRLENGYHEIDTLMNRIDLYDVMIFEKIDDKKLVIESDNPDFPIGGDNLIHKAYEILRSYYKGDDGIKIRVEKNIPIAAGLAGGTSNAITAIKTLNEIWGLGFKNKDLIELSRPIGADSTFFYYDGLIRARGIGDKIEVLGEFHDLPIIIVNIGKPISSKVVYENIKNYSNKKVEKIASNIDDFNIYKENYFNSMEDVSFNIYDELKNIKSELLEMGASVALMSGSGPTIFGIFEDINLQESTYRKIKDKYKYVYKTRLI